MAFSVCIIFLSACSNEIETERAKSSISQVSLKMELGSNLATNLYNEISTVDVYSFWKKNVNSEYTLEKIYQNIKLQGNPSTNNIQFTLDGSAERILYLVANKKGEIPFAAQLDNNTTENAFKEQMILHNNEAIQSPLLMVAKQTIPAKVAGKVISVKFDYAVACLEIDNQYEGFTIDSLVVKDAVCGTSLFTNTATTEAQVARSNINHGNASQICIYQTDASVLAIYGKYGTVKSVFDIPLNNIKKASLYKVTFQKNSNPDSNLQWNVNQWKNGVSVESSPDWTDNN